MWDPHRSYVQLSFETAPGLKAVRGGKVGLCPRMGIEVGTPRPEWHRHLGVRCEIGLSRYLSAPRPDPHRGGRDADVFPDLPQRKCMNVERTRCGLLGRQAAADLW